MLANCFRLALAVALFPVSAQVWAQSGPADDAATAAYPERPVRIIVPFGPGNSYDNTTRYFADKLQARTGQAFVVEPRQGAVGNVAAGYVARQPADGYTIMLAANSTHSANQHLFKELPYDSVADFDPITTLVQVPQALIVSPTLGVNNLTELIELVRQKPGEFNYGSSSATGRVAAESFLKAAGLQAQHIGYKTTTPAVVDLASGQLHFMFTDAASGISNSASDKVKLMGVTSADLLAAAPDVPTMSEAGLPGFEFVAWLALVAPHGTPAGAVQKLSDLSNEIIAEDATRDFLANMYIQPYPGNPEQLRDLIASDTQRWGEMIRAAGIEPQ